MLLDLQKIFRKQKCSNETAKERLKLVLVHDRANVSPQFLEMVKSEIVRVISNYMEIDEDALDFQITRVRDEQENRTVPALVANIPIKNVKQCGK
ncbi:MAG: cell division topological specificity factor MinE [Eubacteriales bacterium]|nr:cell division topological specificity factor MinE [Eubacteriales bacterium]